MAARPFVPNTYVRGEIPLLPEGDGPFTRSELDKIQAAIASLVEFVPQGTTYAPRKPQHGMVRKAMDPWRPLGGTVDLWVQYDADVPGWVAFP